MKKKGPRSERWRIAIVSTSRQMQAQKTLLGICHRADLADNVTLKFFDAFDLGFQEGIVDPLKAWKPHGIIIRIVETKHMESLRRAFPKTPIVSLLWSPPRLVNSCVISDGNETIALARDHFHACGLRHVAFYCGAKKEAIPLRRAAFQDAVPDGHFLAYHGDERPPACHVVRDWLLSLPKPVGVMALESGSGPFVLERCQDAGLRVPEEVQLIGADAEDKALALEPHMTSIELPHTRIGETALETLFRYLEREQSLPPPIVRVTGGKLIQRDSTAQTDASATSLDRAVKFMEAHALEGVSAAEIARQAGMSLSVFYKEFATATGTSPARHLRQLRLKEACRMLRHTSASVTAIAQKCGFRDLTALAHFFRRETGQTPNAYRQGAAGKARAEKRH